MVKSTQDRDGLPTPGTGIIGHATSDRDDRGGYVTTQQHPARHVAETVEEQINSLKKHIELAQAELFKLEHPIIEFPKMVNGRTFATRAEQDAAGQDFADKK